MGMKPRPRLMKVGPPPRKPWDQGDAVALARRWFGRLATIQIVRDPERDAVWFMRATTPNQVVIDARLDLDQDSALIREFSTWPPPMRR